jgi:hypothetical protein
MDALSSAAMATLSNALELAERTSIGSDRQNLYERR